MRWPGVDHVGAFVDALLHGRRPRRWTARADEADAVLMAALLHGTRDDAPGPSSAFVDDLARRLRDQAAADGHQKTTGPRGIGRRGFMQATGIAAAAIVSGGVGEHLLARGGLPPSVAPSSDGSSPPGDDTELVPRTRGRWQVVARFEDLREGIPFRFSAASIEGYALRGGDAVAAVSAVCTHMGCILKTSGSTLLCPCHGATFTTAGTPLQTEYTAPLRPLPRLQARVSGGDVEVFVV